MDRPGKEPQPREGIDIPFGPPPEEYLYRCPVCGAEDLERVMHFIRSQLIVNKAFKRIAGHCDCVSTAVIGSGMARVASQTQL